MRSLCALAVAAGLLLGLAGCGGDEDDATPSRADRVSIWSSRASIYNAVLLGCRQPNPQSGFVTACTRVWRLRYDEATRAAAQAVRPGGSASAACNEALSRARLLIREVDRALTEAYESYAAAVDGESGGSPTGPAVRARLRRADAITARGTRFASRLARDIREHCS